jgi:hypothetical protein
MDILCCSSTPPQLLQCRFQESKCPLITVAALTEAVHVRSMHWYLKHKAEASGSAQYARGLRALTSSLAQTVYEGFEAMPIRWLKHAVTHPLKREGFDFAELDGCGIPVEQVALNG